jgi:hypothetical protein
VSKPGFGYGGGRSHHLVGVLGGERVASVDGVGNIRPERAGWELGWWIGADDRWHLPEEEVAVRQSLVDGMPVVSTSMRVPGGDAVQHVYGAAPNAAVVEIVNESPAPFVAALVVRGASAVDADGTILFVDRRPAILCLRPPARWAMTHDATTAKVVIGGGARDDAFEPRRDRGARLEAAFLFPVAHQTRLRFLVPLRPNVEVDSDAVPGAEEVARGWRAQLDRGMRVELPDAELQGAVDSARAQLLLLAQAWMAVPEVVVALEDWGFDDEARASWVRLGVFARRKAARRPTDRASWEDVRRRSTAGAAEFLNALRSALVDARGTEIQLIGAWPPEWRGLPLDVRDAPTKLGPVSYSVRWHGNRPALLWDVPAGATVRIPGLDGAWSSDEPRGETLLAPVA